MLRRAVITGLAGGFLAAGMALAAFSVAEAHSGGDCAKCRAEHNECRTRSKSLDSSRCDALLIKCLRTCKKR